MKRRSADNRERRKKVKELALKAQLLPKYRRKITRQSVAEAKIKTLPQRNAHVLSEICIICGRDGSWFSLDKV